MFLALYEFFQSLFYGVDIIEDDGYLSECLNTLYQVGYQYRDTQIVPRYLVGWQYLSYICSLISLIFILVLCCLFIYRLIRLVGRLFSGGAL